MNMYIYTFKIYLTPLHDIVLTNFTGTIVLSMFLRLLDRIEPGLADKFHSARGLKPYSVTPFFIKNFPLKATKALRDAKRTVSARNLRSTPTAIKPIGVDIIRAFGLDKRGIPTGEVIQQ